MSFRATGSLGCKETTLGRTRDVDIREIGNGRKVTEDRGSVMGRPVRRASCKLKDGLVDGMRRCGLGTAIEGGGGVWDVVA